jgi:hypothetical protein
MRWWLPIGRQTSTGTASGLGCTSAQRAISWGFHACKDDRTEDKTQAINDEPDAGLCRVGDIDGHAKPDQYGRRRRRLGRGSGRAARRHAFLRPQPSRMTRYGTYIERTSPFTPTAVTREPTRFSIFPYQSRTGELLYESLSLGGRTAPQRSFRRHAKCQTSARTNPSIAINVGAEANSTRPTSLQNGLKFRVSDGDSPVSILSFEISIPISALPWVCSVFAVLPPIGG